MTELSERDRWLIRAGYEAGRENGLADSYGAMIDDGLAIRLMDLSDAPPALKWTTAAPSEPGWYWVKRNNSPHIEIVTESTLYRWDYWAGPIPLPEIADE